MPFPEIDIAVISDVHGTRWALQAVLEDIDRRGIRRIVNLGDSLYGPLAPAQTAEILLGLDLPTVRGNEDRLIVEDVNGSANSPTLRYVSNQLTQEHLDWLAGLEATRIAYEELRLFHGSPDRDDDYLLRVVGEDHVELVDSTVLMARLASVEQPVVLCGHDHLPRTVHLPNGKLIVNPGSVGLPAYADDHPHRHVMEAGTPEARYSVVRKSETGWQAVNVAVAYDWESAAAMARGNGRADWARWLRSGRASLGDLGGT